MTIQNITELAARVNELEAEVEQVKLDLHAELRGNAAMRMRLGAKDGETMFAFTDRLIAERDTLRQQLSEAQAAIEASRKQEAVAWTTPTELDFLKESKVSTAMLFNFTEPDQKFIALYAAPVVAPDVLKDAERYLNALKGAANSLNTIAMLAGRKEYGEPPIATYLETFLEVRGYARNRAMVAFAAMRGAND